MEMLKTFGAIFGGVMLLAITVASTFII